MLAGLLSGKIIGKQGWTGGRLNCLFFPLCATHFLFNWIQEFDVRSR